MRICSQCGRSLEEDAIRCAACGGTIVKLVMNETVGEKSPARVERVSPEPEAQNPSVETVEGWADAFRTWTRQKWFWPALVLVLLGAALMIRLGGASRQPPAEPEVKADPVDAGVRQMLDGVVQAYLPEKLEWGRDLLKHRMPNRFPEELVLTLDPRSVEIQYANPGKTRAAYHVMAAYHFKEAPSAAYIWMAVVFQMENSGGTWRIIGEKWPRSWEVNFE